MNEKEQVAACKHLIDAFTHDEVYLMAAAFETQVDVLTATDRIYPSPEMRSDAAELRGHANLFYRANAMRD